MSKNYFKIIPVILIIILMFIKSTFVQAAESSQTIQPSATSTTNLVLQNLTLEIPAGTTTQMITVSKENSLPTGITIPYGYKPLGNPYLIGPQGLQFVSGKELQLKIRMDDSILNGSNIYAIKLYRINPNTKQLEPVSRQFVDAATNTLTASVSSTGIYATGVEPCWDGNGIKGFTDYVNNGEEHVNIWQRTLSILSPVYSLKSRGLDINLTRIFSNVQSWPADPLYISSGWYWSLPHVYNLRLCMPNGASYALVCTHPWNTDNYYTQTYDCGDFSFRLDFSKPAGDNFTTTTVYLNDGTKIEVDGDYETVTDPRGNWIRYNTTSFSYTEYNQPYCYYRISTLTDSAGHSFNFHYNMVVKSGYHVPELQYVDQQLSPSGLKRILTRNFDDYSNSESFTDCLL